MAFSSIPYEVTGAYEQIVMSLDDVATKANCGFVKRSPIRFEKVGDNLFKCEFFINLLDWKARKNEVNVLVRVRECIRIDGEDLVLHKSSIEVSYFKAGEPVTFLHGMHFDYASDYTALESEIAHPVFHAQLTDKPLAVPGCLVDELDFVAPDAESTIATPFCFARIPTSDMTMASTLLTIAADHIRMEFFCEFLENVILYQGKMPKPLYQDTKESIAESPEHLRSSHWYAHTSGYKQSVRCARNS